MPLNFDAINAPVPPNAFEQRTAQETSVRKGLNPAWIMAPMAGQALDAYGTEQGLSHGHEANPVIEPFASDPAALYALKTGLGLLVGLGANKLAKDGHPGLGKALSIFGTALPAAAGIHNLTMPRK